MTAASYYSYYDGREYLGKMKPCDGGGFDAFNAKGQRLGHFPTTEAACSAIREDTKTPKRGRSRRGARQSAAHG